MRAIAPVLLLVACPAWSRDTLDQFGRWGAFREGTHCYAVAEPGNRRSGGSISLSSSAARGVRMQFDARLSRDAEPGRPIALRIGALSVPLVARGRAARTADARADLRILAAIRQGDLLVIAATDARGRRFSDRYPLAGAASAVDAALIGCIAP